jgi:signal transduction histidine kinase
MGLAICVFIANTGVAASMMFLSGHDLRLLLVLCGYAFAATAIPAFAFGRNVGQRLHLVEQAASRIAAGDLTARVGLRGSDDIARLAVAFDSMAGELQEANTRRDAMEQARRELFAAISHDLRTPLSSIRVMVEALADGVVDDRETTGRYLQTMSSDVERLSLLIEDLFELARIESGALELRREPIALEEVLASAVDSALPGATLASVHVELSPSPSLLMLEADPQRLNRVLTNLLQNAIRHTPADGAVTVSAAESEDGIVVAVSDTGEGIPEGDLPHVFDRFYRAERSRNRMSGGSGLGLSISRGIVEAHGGRIWIDTTSEVGTVVKFALPKAVTRVSDPRVDMHPEQSPL